MLDLFTINVGFVVVLLYSSKVPTPKENVNVLNIFSLKINHVNYHFSLFVHIHDVGKP